MSLAISQLTYCPILAADFVKHIETCRITAHC